MELLVMVDAIRRASALRITAVVPYFAMPAGSSRTLSSSSHYRQGRRRYDVQCRVDRVLTVDLHADQIQGF